MSLEEIIMKTHRLVLLNDMHIPFHDKKTISSIKRAVKKLKPDILLLGGDIADFYSVSHFNKNPSRLEKNTLSKETTQVKETLKDMTKWGAKDIKYMMGNHEERLQKYIYKNSPELHWIKGLKIEEILGLKELDIEFIENRFWKHKGVMYSHLNKCLKWGGASAKNLGLDYNCPVVHTHNHKVGHVRLGDRDFYDNGCLCKLEAEYVSGPVMWNQAFMIVDYLKDKPYFRQINIKNHKFILNNELYTPEGVFKLNKDEPKRKAKRRRTK